MKTFLDPRQKFNYGETLVLKKLGYDFPFWVTIGTATDPTTVFLGPETQARRIAKANPCASIGLLFFYDAGAQLSLSSLKDRFLAVEDVGVIIERNAEKLSRLRSG